VPWSTPFDDSVPLPNVRKLLTLKDAADYITGLPKAEQDLPHWQVLLGLCRQSAQSPP
jgi:hypothetical protein